MRAGSLARQIGAAIIHKNTAQLRNVEYSDSHSKAMWAKVRELVNLQARQVIAPQGISAQS